MLFPLARPLLFTLDPERAHAVACAGIDLLAKLPTPAAVRCPRRVMGLEFPNPVGLAAGFDKNGDHIEGLAALGFGFLEIGTVTPRPQPGNPQPRLFRLPQARAIINRMGFNNAGVAHLVARVQAARARGYQGVLGINIGKNFDTPVERAEDDYVVCLRAVYPHADYITVNISSPNTKNLRALQEGAALERLLGAVRVEREALAATHGRRVPVAVKIAPDLESAQIAEIATLLQRYAIDAVIATNTTIARDAVQDLPHAEEGGGLSGAPLTQRSREVVAALAQALAGAIPIIGVGGISSGAEARAMLAAGASLVQLYTGFIYRGPALVREAARATCAQGN
ncbi:MAG: quinone-dependent dihydroorotate dehydrogenase [Burkholderiales bacterium]